MVRHGAIAVLAAVSLGACSGSDTGRVAAPTSEAVTRPSTSVAQARPCATTTTVHGAAGGGEVNPPGDIPDNQAFVEFSPNDRRYSVKIPEGWARSEQSGIVRFTDKFNTVAIEVKAVSAPPSPEGVKSEEVPALAAALPCVTDVRVSSVRRKAGPVILVTLRSDGYADPVTGKVVRDDVERYEFWRAGTEVVITLSGAVGSDNVDPWRTVTDSFQWH